MPGLSNAKLAPSIALTVSMIKNPWLIMEK
jgi:hypothetical protein